MKRDNNIDFLRIASMFAIIVLHVSSLYLNNEEYSPNGLVAAFIYDALTRFAVPCFVMISGGLVLPRIKVGETIEFYRKSIKKLLIPTVLFSLFYTLYNLSLVIMDSYLQGKRQMSTKKSPPEADSKM